MTWTQLMRRANELGIEARAGEWEDDEEAWDVAWCKLRYELDGPLPRGDYDAARGAFLSGLKGNNR